MMATLGLEEEKEEQVKSSYFKSRDRVVRKYSFTLLILLGTGGELNR